MVRSLMGSGNSCSQCHHSYANDNVDKAICIIILTRKWEETKIMQDICWNGCIVTLKKYHEFFLNDWFVRIQSAHLNFLIQKFGILFNLYENMRLWHIHFNSASHETYFIFFLLPYETSSKHDLPRGKGLVGLIFEVGQMEYFLLLPMVEVSSEQ